MADTDTLTPEDLEELKQVHQHLSDSGDLRADKVRSYIQTQVPSYGREIIPKPIPLNPGDPGYFAQEHPVAAKLIQAVGSGMPGPMPLDVPMPSPSTFAELVPSAFRDSMPSVPGVVKAASHLPVVGRFVRPLVTAYDVIRGLAPDSTGAPETGTATRFWDATVPKGPTMAPAKYSMTPSANPAPELQPLDFGEPGMPKYRVPLWNRNLGFMREIRSTPDAPSQPFSPIPATSLPSGRVPGVPNSPLTAPTTINPEPIPASGIQPIQGEATLPPASKSELNRMLHAKVQRLNLPGSPAGERSPGFLTSTAQKEFGSSYDKLNLNQLRDLYDRLDKYSQ